MLFFLFNVLIFILAPICLARICIHGVANIFADAFHRRGLKPVTYTDHPHTNR